MLHIPDVKMVMQGAHHSSHQALESKEHGRNPVGDGAAPEQRGGLGEAGRAHVLLLPSGYVAEHIRMDIQTDICHVVEMLAGNEPDDLANLAL